MKTTELDRAADTWSVGAIEELASLRAEVARLRADLADARRIIEGMTEKQARTEAMLRTAAVAHTRAQEALDFTLSCLRHHHMTKPGISALVEKAEAKAKAKGETK